MYTNIQIVINKYDEYRKISRNSFGPPRTVANDPPGGLRQLLSVEGVDLGQLFVAVGEELLVEPG